MATIIGKGAPGIYTAGGIGDIYKDSNTGLTYKCISNYDVTKVNGRDPEPRYQWVYIPGSGEGSGGSDYSWDNLKNRPFYEEEKEYHWDGSTEGRDYFTLNIGTYYKISDDTPSADSLSSMYVYENGNPLFRLNMNYNDETCFNDRMNGFLVVCYSTTINYNGDTTITVPSTGIYYSSNYPTFYIKTTNLKKLDSKFLPEDHINSLIDAKLGVIENGTY